MTDLTKIFINLIKCSEEQQEHIISLLPDPELDEDYTINSKYCYLRFDIYKWFVGSIEGIESLSELTYLEFIRLFEGGEGERKSRIEIMTDKELQEELRVSQSHIEVLEHTIRSIENEIFYRANPNLNSN